MSEKPPETVQGAVEAPVLPVPVLSPASGATTSESADALEERLVSRLTPIIERAVQSTKDKRFSKLDELIAVAQQIKAVGHESFVAARDVIKDEQPVSDPGRSEDGAQLRMQAESEILLRDAGVPFDDAEYKQLVDKYGGRIKRPEDWSPIVKTFADARKRRAAPANAAQVVPEATSVSPASEPEEADAIIKKLENLPLPRTRADRDARAKLKNRLNELTGGTRDIGVVT